MYGFEHMLFKNEKLIFSGKARPDLMPKDEDIGLKYICLILFLLFLLFFLCFLIFNSFNKHYIEKGEIIGIAILGLAVFALIYNAIYKTFIKKKKVFDYEYGLTNLRILIYNKKANRSSNS